MDELFEILTLQQTHKAPPMPIGCSAATIGDASSIFDGLVEEGMIAAEDFALFAFGDDPEEGCEAMLQHGPQAHSP
jgi:predicted Rossmann-fold nucleotide-binding protein